MENSDKIIEQMLGKLDNITDPSKKTKYLKDIAKAASNADNLSEESIKTLFDNINNIDNNNNNKAEYLCNIAKAASNATELSKDTINKLLDNIEKIDEDNKAEYLDNVVQAFTNTNTKLSNSTILSLSKAAANTKNLKNATIENLINFSDNIKYNKKYKKDTLINIITATINTETINYSTMQNLIDTSKYNHIDEENIKILNSKKTIISTVWDFTKYIQNKLTYSDKDINSLISILNSLDNSIKGDPYCLCSLSEAATKTQDISDTTINKLLKNSSLESLTPYVNKYLFDIANATNKIPNPSNIMKDMLKDDIINRISETKNMKGQITATKQENQLNYLYILSKNSKNNEEIIELLLQKGIKYGMFKDETNSSAVKRLFARNLIDAASRLDQNEAKKLYKKLYEIATNTKDNTNPVKQNDKNDLNGLTSTNLPNNAQSSSIPPMLTLFFAKLDKTLGYQDDQIQTDLINAITHRKDGHKDANLDPKVPLHPALNYLKKEQLNDIDESAIANRIMTTNDAKDIQQFELEYLIDLKLSHELYELNKDDGQDKFIEILTKHYDILTNKFDKQMKSSTQTSKLAGDLSNSSGKIASKVKMNIPIEAQDGVYNLALIALKQMEPKDREGFLNKLIQKLSKGIGTKKTNQTIGLLEQLKTNNKFDNDKLLDTKPVLRQYNDKSQTVSNNYQPNLTSFRMPRTTDKCEIFKENGITYLGFKDTSYKIKTSLDTKTAKLLFDSQSSNGHQMIGNCWLISELKQIEADPQLKLFIYSHFDATVKKTNKDKDEYELESVSINLKDGRKVTFSKDVVAEVSKIGATEHLSPAMSCLALLSAIYRTTKDVDDTNHIDNIFPNNNDEITIDKNSEILSRNFDKDNPILNALRISNEAGHGYNDLLSLFINKDEKSNDKNLKRDSFFLEGHQIAQYGDFKLNPQNSYSLFIFNKTRKLFKENYLNKIKSCSSDFSYYIPKIGQDNQYCKTEAYQSFFSRTVDFISRIFSQKNTTKSSNFMA